MAGCTAWNSVLSRGFRLLSNFQGHPFVGCRITFMYFCFVPCTGLTHPWVKFRHFSLPSVGGRGSLATGVNWGRGIGATVVGDMGVQPASEGLSVLLCEPVKNLLVLQIGPSPYLKSSKQCSLNNCIIKTESTIFPHLSCIYSKNQPFCSSQLKKIILHMSEIGC